MGSDDEASTRQRKACCLAAALLVISLTRCLVSGDRCDANQRLGASQANVCVCVEGTVPDPRGYGCSPCAANETAVGIECRCKPGFERKAAAAPCIEATGGVLGVACDEETPCGAAYPYCALVGEARYCTIQGCKTQDACPMTWRCETSAGGSFCAQPPQGLEQPCMSAADCAGTEATFCDQFYTNKCYVEKCATGDAQCPSGYSCCDVTALVSTSICVPMSLLQGGLCPDGNLPVPQ